LIVEDIALAREKLRLYLSEEPDIIVVGEASDGREAARLMAVERPDLVLLDVQLPDMDAFEVMAQIEPSSRPIAIFLTAHEQHALKAFDVNALDYLLKPFDRARLSQALNRARRQLHLRTLEVGASAVSDYLRRLAIKDGDRVQIVDVREVDYVDVAGHYLCIHVGKTVYLTRGSLAEFEKRLDPAEFVRVHRSALARIDRIKAVEARRNGDLDLILSSGGRVAASRTYRDLIRVRLGLESL
jgi:two-component system LytT family response regulator